MNTDASLIVQIQIALIGIILITGLFFVWRALCRIEDKVNNVLSNSIVYPQSSECKLNLDDPNSAAEALMKEVFGSEEPIMVFSEMKHDIENPVPSTNVNTTTIEEIHEDKSEADTESSPLSKNKLHRMDVEKLRELCKEKELPTDGTKKILIERLTSSS